MTLETSEKLLLSADEAAQLCGVGRTLWLAMNNAGKTPLPVRLGRRLLWSAQELRDWTAAGCPSREKWEIIKRSKLGKTEKLLP